MIKLDIVNHVADKTVFRNRKRNRLLTRYSTQ